MDMLKIVRSIEALLFEAMTWVLFYPRTLWRCLFQPDWIIAYTDKELVERPGEQFTDMISPPLFLIISVAITYGIGVALGARLQPGDSESLRLIAGKVENLLAFRALFLSIFPITMAAGLLQARGQPLERDALRNPFYLQCYLAAPFAIMAGSASALLEVPGNNHQIIGGALMTVALLWLTTVQTRWFYHQTAGGWWTAFGLALRYIGLAVLLVIGLGLMLVLI